MTSEFMEQALALSDQAKRRVSPNPAVGAVLVSEGQVLGKGYTEPPGGRHAEIVALEAAGPSAQGSTLYVTLEPCSHHGRTPPCTDAILKAGVARVVFSIEDPDPQVRGSGAARLKEGELEVQQGDGAEAAGQLLEAYLKHRRTGRPFVTVKYAASLDGRIAASSGDSKWVSGSEARLWAHSLRAASDAIAVGSGTVLADDPQLTARPAGTDGVRQPLRVILDSRGRVSPVSQVFSPEAATLVATTEASLASWRASIAETGAQVSILSQGENGGVDLASLLEELGQMEITNLLVEGGAVLLGSLFDQRLVDKVAVVIAPLFIGSAKAPTAIAGRGASHMSEVSRLSRPSYQQLGDDLLIEGYPMWREAASS